MLNKNIDKCRTLVAQADAVVIGAGAGLSNAAGLHYSGKRFTDNFPDFIERYGLTDMYSSMFYSWPTPEERWAYVSRHTLLNRYDKHIGKPYFDLLKLVEGKAHFVLTTNGDALFYRAGFNPKHIFATQGDYSKFQCSTACHDTLYDNEESIRKMVASEKDCKVPAELVPICPVCGGPMEPYLRINKYFIENNDWHQMSKNYQAFISNHLTSGSKLVLLELGVGFNTPGIIRWPFEQITAAYSNCSLIRVNMDNVQNSNPVPEDRSVLIKGDIAEFIEVLSVAKI